jgi:uncharacterized protein (DUF427 family)
MMWRWTGRERPPWAEEPGPGQESVWDFPRPPRVEPVAEELRVVVRDVVVARTTRGLRVVETAGAPVYYFPPDDVRLDLLEPGRPGSVCEWKGIARYWRLRIGGKVVPDIGWSYPDPPDRYGALAGWLAFYAGKVDEAWVGEVRAEPQPGGFYGGWVTPDLAGPIKGGPGSSGW